MIGFHTPPITDSVTSTAQPLLPSQRLLRMHTPENHSTYGKSSFLLR